MRSAETTAAGRWFRPARAALVALMVAGVTAGTATASTAEPARQSWVVPVTQITGDDTNVTESGGLTVANTTTSAASAHAAGIGYLVSDVHRFPTAVNQITAGVTGTMPAGTSVEVDVRAVAPDGDWTEWMPVPATFATAATQVQARVELSAAGSVKPVVTGVRLDAGLAAGQAAGLVQPAVAAGSYKVYATREGLVGGTTASGHVITSRDHFVALPSARGLSTKNTGTYTVKVCTTSRCEWAPVWDVGPWNTKDDYWNPSSTRQMWTNLPQGKPEAQAAYQDGYNGGEDQFGRSVTNPAGIDLADGVFWDGLGMTDNGWVTVTYLWTGSGTTGTVSTAGSPMNVRSGPHTTSTAVGLAANYAKVAIECQTGGDSVTGTFGTSTLWDRISTGFYVSDAYVYTGSDGQVAPNC